MPTQMIYNKNNNNIKQTDRQTDGQRQRQTDRQTETERDREREGKKRDHMDCFGPTKLGPARKCYVFFSF